MRLQPFLRTLLLALLSGCFLFLLLGREIVTSVSDDVDAIFAAVEARATTSICRSSSTSDCTYVIDGRLETSSALLLSELEGAGIIIDPRAAGRRVESHRVLRRRPGRQRDPDRLPPPVDRARGRHP